MQEDGHIAVDLIRKTSEMSDEVHAPRQLGTSIRMSDHDIERKELKWNKNEEKLVYEWMDECKHRAEAHARCARKFKKMFVVFGIPATVIPIAMSGVVLDVLPREAVSSCMILSGIITGVASFMNYGEKYARHSEYEARFLELHHSMAKEMCKPMAFRTAVDAYMEVCLGNFNRLCAGAPDT